MLFSSSAIAQGQGELISEACSQCDPDKFSGYFFESFWTNDQSQSTGECEWRCENESITFAKKSFCNSDKTISGTAVLMKLKNGQSTYVVVGNPQQFSFGGGSSTGPHVFPLDQTEPEGIYRIRLSVNYGGEFCDEGFIDPSYCVSGLAESAPLVTVNGVDLSTDPDAPTFFCGSRNDPQFSDPNVLLSGICGTGDLRFQGHASGGLCTRYEGQFFPFDGSEQSEYLNLTAYPCPTPFYTPNPGETGNQFFNYRLELDWGDNPCNYPSVYNWYLEFEPIDGIIDYDYVISNQVNISCNNSNPDYSNGSGSADVSVPGPSLGANSMGITNGSNSLQNATMTSYSVYIETGAGDQVYSSLNNQASTLPFAFQPISHVANPGFVDGNPNFFQLHSGLDPIDCTNDPYCTDGVQYFITVEINTAECGSLTRTTPFTICQNCNFCLQAPTNTGYDSMQSLEEGGSSSSTTTQVMFNRYNNSLAFQFASDLDINPGTFFIITNVLGQEVVLQDEIVSRFESWDLTSVQTGIYVVTVYGEGEPISEILVK